MNLILGYVTILLQLLRSHKVECVRRLCENGYARSGKGDRGVDEYSIPAFVWRDYEKRDKKNRVLLYTRRECYRYSNLLGICLPTV